MIPSQRLTIRDPGLGLTAVAGTVIFHVGCASKGEPLDVLSLSTPADVVDELGEGPLAEEVAGSLRTAGGPQYAVPVTATIAGAVGDVDANPASTGTGTITVGGTPNDRYEAVVEIMRSGALGVATFRLSLDGGRTYSEARTVPLGGAYVVPRTGLTITFVPGAGPILFERGDVHYFDTTAPHYGAAEVSAACDAIDAYLGTLPGTAADAIALTGVNPTGTAAAVIFGVFGAKLAGLALTHQYMGGVMDAGSDDTPDAVRTAFAAVADPRIMPVYGFIDLPSAKSFEAFAAPRVPLLNAVVGRVARARISIDLARTAGDPREAGPITGALGISHDEYRKEELDAAKITTARTWPGVPGYFLTNGRLKSAVGSDFRHWQHRRVMDVACRTVIAAQQQFSSAEFDTNDDGSLTESEARRIEEVVRDRLREVLLDPINASGLPGHVADFSYTVSRTNNVVSTETLVSNVSIRPLGYTKNLETEIGFALNVGGV